MRMKSVEEMCMADDYEKYLHQLLFDGMYIRTIDQFVHYPICIIVYIFIYLFIYLFIADNVAYKNKM